MTTLKDINFGMNQFCGPAVLSAFTGKSTDECAAVISAISGKREIRAVEVTHLIQAFEKLRFTVTKENVHGHTLYGVLTHLINRPEGLFIVGVPRHVVAVEVKDKKIYIVDNHAKQPLPAEGSARLIQKVDMVYRLTPRPEPKFLKTEVKIEYRVGGHISINAYDTYENEADNTKVSMGYIYYRKDEDLRELIKQLTQLKGVWS